MVADAASPASAWGGLRGRPIGLACNLDPYWRQLFYKLRRAERRIVASRQPEGCGFAAGERRQALAIGTGATPGPAPPGGSSIS